MADNGKPDLKGYKILERIGSGGFGVVYRAKQTTIGREVAVKVILPELANKPDFIRRFDIEAQLIARLEHPFIIPLIDYWRDPSGAYLVMRYLRGGNIRKSLETGAYDLVSTSHVLDQVASALDFAHRNKVIHRDIKPANILLDEEGNAYLADFGIAKDLNDLRGSISNADSTVGSSDYIAPEQARGEPATPRTDIYSLGVMLFEMITGHHPFHEVSSVERLYKHINEPLPDIEGLSDDVRDTINEIIHHATEKNPADRYPDVLALTTAFRKVVGRGDSSAELRLIQELTMRQHEILNLIVDGMSNKEIADIFVVAVSTVKWHIRQIYKKLNVRNRVQAILRARELNLIKTNGNDDASLSGSQQLSATGLLPEPENPYKGLHAFQTSDARNFFGRESLVEKMIGRLAEDHAFQRFLAIVGPSGSGKSSLAKAGLIPALWRGGLPSSEKWFIIDMILGSRPLDELEIALIRIAANQSDNLREQLQRDEFGLVRAADLILPQDDTELVLVIDQFEELFIQVENESERHHFLNLLYTAATDKRSRIRIVVTLRADYYDKPLHYPQFGKMLRSRMETILPLSTKELELAIRRPAEQAGVSFEPGLVAQITSQMSYQTAALPLLQYALTELFDRREERFLTHQAYADIGEAVGALTHRADEIYRNMDSGGQELTRQLFLRLVTLGENGEDTRRRVLFREILSITDDVDLMEEIIDNFSDYRLLTLAHDEHSRRPTLEVAHEAILDGWERLRKWVDESREDIRQERIVAQIAEAWDVNNRDKSYLLRGSRLENIEVWLEATDLILTQFEKDFIRASITHREAEAQTEAKRQELEMQLEQSSANRLRIAVAIFVVATVISFSLAIVALIEWNKSRLAADQSLSVSVASNAEIAFINDEHDLALALAIAANELVDESLPQVRRTLVDIAYAPGLRAIWRQDSNRLSAFAISPDGRYMVTGEGGRRIDLDGEIPVVSLWDVTTGEEIRFFGNDGTQHTGTVFAATFTPDSRYVITAGVNNEAFRWDVETGEMLQRYRLPDEGYFQNIAVSPDGKTLLSNDCSLGHPATRCEGGWIINQWDVETGELLNSFYEELLSTSQIVFSPDGQSFYKYITFLNEQEEWSSFVIRRDILTGEEIFRYEYPRDILTIVMSPDGQLLALADSLNQIVLLDSEVGEELRSFESPIIDVPIDSLSFSPDGRTILSGSSDALVRLWDVATGAEINRFRGHATGVNYVVFTSDGQQAISQSNDGDLMVWDILPGNHRLSYAPENVIGIWEVAILSDGERVLFTTGTNTLDPELEGDHPIILFNMVTGEEIWRTSGQLYTNYSIAISPDETMVLTTSRNSDHPARLWDIETGEELQQFGNSSVSGRAAAAFTPDSRQILISTNGIIQLFDIETGFEIRRFIHGGDTGRISVSLDGRFMASTDWFTGVVKVWSFETGELLQTFRDHAEGVIDVSFLPDNNQVISGALDGTIRIWDIERGEQIQLFDGVAAVGRSWAVLNGEGNLVLFTTPEHNVVLLELETGNELAQFTGYSVGTGATFSSDSRTVVTIGWDGVLHVWDVPLRSSDEMIAWTLENRVVRDLTSEECLRFRLCEPEPKSTREPISTIIVPTLPTATPIYDISDTQIAELGTNRGWVLPGELVNLDRAGGDIDPGGYDVWAYQGQAGEHLTIHIIADRPAVGFYGFSNQIQNEVMNTWVQLYDPNGRFLIENNDISQEDWNSRIESYELPVDGSYRIEVSGAVYYTGGDYTLIIESDREQ